MSDNISLDELIYSNRSNSNKEISFISYDNFSLVMNSKKQITIAAVVLSSLLSIVSSDKSNQDLLTVITNDIKSEL